MPAGNFSSPSKLLFQDFSFSPALHFASLLSPQHHSVDPRSSLHHTTQSKLTIANPASLCFGAQLLEVYRFISNSTLCAALVSVGLGVLKSPSRFLYCISALTKLADRRFRPVDSGKCFGSRHYSCFLVSDNSLFQIFHCPDERDWHNHELPCHCRPTPSRMLFTTTLKSDSHEIPGVWNQRLRRAEWWQFSHTSLHRFPHPIGTWLTVRR